MIATTDPVEDELCSYASHLGRMSEQLTQTSSQIEDSVVSVCQSFQEIASRAKATVSKGRSFIHDSGALVEASNGSFDELLQRCSGALVSVLKITELSTEVSRRAVERVKQIDQASQKITGALGQLDEITKGNRIMALNARIEAAHAKEKGAGFAVVAVEVAAQSERSRQVTARVSDFVEELRGLAASTLSDLEQSIVRDRTDMERCRFEVEGTMEELNNSHRAMQQVLDGMSREGESLAQDIGAAIRGMQFQDRVSQRISHVVQDLNILKTRLSAHHSEDEATTAPFVGCFSSYTMREERLVAGLTESESAAGDIELF
jgi:methyl-accepting chemotaxis protein